MVVAVAQELRARGYRPSRQGPTIRQAVVVRLVFSGRTDDEETAAGWYVCLWWFWCGVGGVDLS